MLTLITGRARRWVREYRRREQLRDLLSREDRLLQDIGLTRTDIEAALGRPMAEDARDYAYRYAARTLALDGLR